MLDSAQNDRHNVISQISHTHIFSLVTKMKVQRASCVEYMHGRTKNLKKQGEVGQGQNYRSFF